jgi:3-deoxy-D-manno-octulosonic-acid transferase
MLIIYRIIYFLISHLLLLLHSILPLHLKKWVDLRRQKFNLASNEKQRILFHAASGEIEYVKSVIRNLKIKNPQIEIYVSYTSPSAEKLFANIRSDVVAFLPLPWDSPVLIKKFLGQLRPDVIVISRTDFWPEFIHQAGRLKIPLTAVSLFPTLGYFQNIWLKFNLSKMSLITAVNENLCEQLNQILDHKIKTVFVPDTRFDQVLYRLKQPSKFEIVSDQKICVFGSTWPEDEIILFEMTSELISAGYQIIWCPHHVSALQIQKLKFKLSSFSVSILSEIHSPYNFSRQILIVDRVGFLADMYKYSQFSFVGGSFKSKVHSVMEPLCAGNPVIVGPFYKNNPEAIDGIKNGFVFSVKNKSDFLNTIQKIDFSKTKEDLLKNINQMIGSSEVTANMILSFLPRHK